MSRTILQYRLLIRAHLEIGCYNIIEQMDLSSAYSFDPIGAAWSSSQVQSLFKPNNQASKQSQLAIKWSSRSIAHGYTLRMSSLISAWLHMSGPVLLLLYYTYKRKSFPRNAIHSEQNGIALPFNHAFPFKTRCCHPNALMRSCISCRVV